MKPGRSVAAVLLMIVLAGVTYADVAPATGYIRIDTGVVLETKDDLGKYRFFLVSNDLVRPINLKKGEKAFVGSLGRGARYSSGTIVAIPAKSLSSFGEDPRDEKLAEMKAAIAKDGVTGAIKLITHLFRRDVPQAEAVTVSDAMYRIEKTATGLTAVPSGPKAAPAGSSVGRSIGAEVVAGILLSLGFMALGFCRFRPPARIKA